MASRRIVTPLITQASPMRLRLIRFIVRNTLFYWWAHKTRTLDPLIKKSAAPLVNLRWS